MTYVPVWVQNLQPASWRGIVFQVDSSAYETGRRIVTHLYPFRDDPWNEDLGLAKQQVSFTGFLNGDDCYQQRDQLADACNSGGSGMLVHPSLGSQNATLISASFGETKESGRTVQVHLVFVLSQQASVLTLYPETTPDTQGACDEAADDVDQTSSDDYLDDIQTTIQQGEYVTAGVVETVSSFAAQVITVAQDAAAVVSSVVGLAMILPAAFELGRYAIGNLTTIPQALVSAGINTSQSVFSIIDQGTSALIEAAAVGQANVEASTATAQSSSATPDNTTFVQSVQTVTESLRQAINDPSDQIRLLASLASFTVPPLPPGFSTINTSIQAAKTAVTALCRRATLTSLARACADYQPQSTNDVTTILQTVAPLYDAEILNAADSGDLQTYSTMSNLKSAVVTDLETRGTNLPSLITVTLKTATPNCVLAYQLYDDSTRADQLLQMNPTVIHPLFCPSGIQALSS